MSGERISDGELAALFEHDETCGDESYTHLDSLIDGDPIELGRLCARLARELQERRSGPSGVVLDRDDAGAVWEALSTVARLCAEAGTPLEAVAELRAELERQGLALWGAAWWRDQIQEQIRVPDWTARDE